MKYTIQNIHHESHDMDDDIIYFYFDIHFTEPEAMVIKNYFYPFSMLLSYLKEKHLSFYQYIEATRKSTDAWGPAEKRTIEAMGEEALRQLYAYVEEYLLNCDWMEKHYHWEKERRSKPPQQQIQTQERASEIFKDLSADADEINKAQKRYYKFCETVERKIRETASEIYPEIANLEPEQLKEFKYLFVREIQDMHSNIEKLLSGKKD